MSSMIGHILISMPHLTDPYFARSLVFICDHDEKGAMGLIVNKSFEDTSIKKIFPTLIINDEAIRDVISPIYFGGPVELESGFLLHSSEFRNEDTLPINADFSLTSNHTIIDAIHAGIGPQRYKMMLGYAGWGAGQLERELENGDWLFQEGDPAFVFQGDDTEKWLLAAQSFGINIAPATAGLA
ncbi:MAG: YqgE/AlgH family protein [Candidatus Marinimicrobia bacterium]|nr:YqgE/AlgH family protein [Candidatus Neomarinimicrobiota bacterium]